MAPPIRAGCVGAGLTAALRAYAARDVRSVGERRVMLERLAGRAAVH